MQTLQLGWALLGKDESEVTKLHHLVTSVLKNEWNNLDT